MNLGFMTISAHDILELLKTNAFYAGIAVGAILLFLLIVFLNVLHHFRSKCHNIVVAEDDGRFEISDVAIRSFVKTAIEKFPQVTIGKIALFNCRGRYHLSIRLSVKSGTNVTEIHKTIRDYLKSEFDAKLGILQYISSINFKITEINDAKAIPEAE